MLSTVYTVHIFHPHALDTELSNGLIMTWYKIFTKSVIKSSA